MSSSFDEFTGDAVSFFGAESTNKTVAECGVSTNGTNSCDKSNQTSKKHHVEIQAYVEPQSSKPDYNDEALLEFMRRMAPKVENELRRVNKYFGSNYAEKLSEVDTVLTKRISILSKHETSRNLIVSHLSWNCYSTKVAVAFNEGVNDQNLTHSSYILIYESDKNDEFQSSPKNCIEVSFRINHLKFHPTISSIFVYVTDQCRLFWHDINESVETNSKNFSELVTAAIKLSWVDLESMLYVAIAGTDGYLYLVSAEPFADERLVSKIFMFENNFCDYRRSIQCFDFSVLNSKKFVVALSGGLLVSCSIEFAQATDKSKDIFYPVINSFDSPKVVINDIRYSTFENDVFVTTSSDQYLRIYQTNETSPSYVIAIEFIALAVEWSHLQENIVKAWSSDGELRFYNYRQCTMVKCLKFENQINLTASSVKGMKELIVIGNLEDISIWQTSLTVH